MRTACGGALALGGGDRFGNQSPSRELGSDHGERLTIKDLG